MKIHEYFPMSIHTYIHSFFSPKNRSIGTKIWRSTFTRWQANLEDLQPNCCVTISKSLYHLVSVPVIYYSKINHFKLNGRKQQHLLIFLIMLEIDCAQLDGSHLGSLTQLQLDEKWTGFAFKASSLTCLEVYIVCWSGPQRSLLAETPTGSFSMWPRLPASLAPAFQGWAEREMWEWESENKREKEHQVEVVSSFMSFRSHRVSLLSYLIRYSRHKKAHPVSGRGRVFTFSWRSDKVLWSTLNLTVNTTLTTPHITIHTYHL